MTDFAETMPLAKLLGISTSVASKEKVLGHLTVAEDVCTIGSSVHGGTLMAFADSVAAIGAFLNLPDGASGTTTIESKTNFLGRAQSGDQLLATSTPLSVGRRLSVWQTRITGKDEKLIAVITQTQLVL
ncbi:MAG: PaaI family thioesterase [Pseudomonadota bacterium]